MTKFRPDYGDEYADEVKKTEIEVVTDIDFKDFYVRLHDFIKSLDYEDIDGDNTNWEQKFVGYEYPNGNIQYIIWWRMMKQPHPLFLSLLKINLELRNATKREINLNGRRVKTDYGELNIRMSAYLFTDPEYKLRNSFIGKYFPIFYKHHYKKQREYYEDLLKYEEFERIQEFIKKFLNVYSLKKEAEPLDTFFPKKGIKP